MFHINISPISVVYTVTYCHDVLATSRLCFNKMLAYSEIAQHATIIITFTALFYAALCILLNCHMIFIIPCGDELTSPHSRSCRPLATSPWASRCRPHNCRSPPAFTMRTALASDVVSSCDLELWPMIFTCKLDLHKVKVIHHVKHIRRKSFCSKVIIQTHKHTQPTDCITRPLKRSLIMLSCFSQEV